MWAILIDAIVQMRYQSKNALYLFNIVLIFFFFLQNMKNEIEENFNFETYQNLIVRLSTLAFDDRRKDVTFVFQGSDTRIKAHKCILEAVSPVFERMFSGSFVENEEVQITDITPEIFGQLIRYSWTLLGSLKS